MLSSPIIPAVIPQSFRHLSDQVSLLRGLPEIHVDVVDGIFVPSKSWPYIEGSDVTESQILLQSFSLEVDLMVANPLPAALSWLQAGADQLVFHIETITSEQLKDFYEHHDVTIGLSLNSSTPLSKLDDYLPYADYVQLMGIAQIGSQGQPFDETVFDRINSLKAKYPNIAISIDGSVNKNTLPNLSEYNLYRYIVGSGIMAATDPLVAYRELTQILSS